MRDNFLNCRLDNSSTYDYVRVANEWIILTEDVIHSVFFKTDWFFPIRIFTKSLGQHLSRASLKVNIITWIYLKMYHVILVVRINSILENPNDHQDVVSHNPIKETHTHTHLFSWKKLILEFRNFYGTKISGNSFEKLINFLATFLEGLGVPQPQPQVVAVWIRWMCLRCWRFFPRRPTGDGLWA